MCNGPLLWKILLFSVPLMLSGILQLLFNAADIVVVGQFAGNEAMAAVGSTGSLNNLIVNVFMGLSIGTSIMVARYYGLEKHAGNCSHLHACQLYLRRRFDFYWNFPGGSSAGADGNPAGVSGSGSFIYAYHFCRNAGANGI